MRWADLEEGDALFLDDRAWLRVEGGWLDLATGAFTAGSCEQDETEVSSAFEGYRGGEELDVSRRRGGDLGEGGAGKPGRKGR